MQDSLSKRKISSKIYDVLTEYIFPILLLTSTGAFSWAIRGCAGYGTIRGCVFVGCMLSSVWLLLSHENTYERQRRYSSGWIVLALVVGIGIGGMRGWGQYPQWCNGIWRVRDYDYNYVVSIHPLIGYFWLFIAGSGWAGMGSALLAWTGSKKQIKKKDWILRLSMGFGSGLLAYILFKTFPGMFLPLYDSLEYDNFLICTECSDAIDDIGVALVMFAILIGFYLYEIIKKDWMNVKLITIVTMISGFLWVIFMLLGMDDIWWRVWEGSAGIGIGFAYGVAYVVCNRKLKEDNPYQRKQKTSRFPQSEKIIGIYIAYFFGLGWSTHQVIQGHLDIYWNIDTPTFNWSFLIPWGIHGMVFLSYLVWRAVKESEKKINPNADPLPEYIFITAFVYLSLRIYGLMVTGPLDNPWERGFFMFYLIQMSIEILIMIITLLIKKKQN
ncbi:MAG: hypothetical protein GF364_18915 [Candidatus Lokiarchaeota archaeon]|nr:hypothetical protein [Candidatus Lokiarchaeota archaeon]